MSVSKTDANGAGSVGSPVSAPTTTDSAAPAEGMPKPGLANGSNTTWSRKVVQVAESSRRPGSLDFKRIGQRLDELELAELRFVFANNNYVRNPNDETRKAYANEKERYGKAQIEFGLFIENQTNERARDSSLYLRGHGLKNCAEVRQLEGKIVDHAPSPHSKDHLEKAIRENRALRAPRELRALSAKMQETNNKLNSAQTREGTHIIADATEAVTGRREEDSDLPPNQVAKNQLDRLNKLLDAATKTEDGVTGNAKKVDPALYDQLTDNITGQMGQLDPDSKASFDTIVASYRDRLAPDKSRSL